MIRVPARQFRVTMTACVSEDKFIEYRPGNMNLILSVPHGGSLRPDFIPDRDAGSFKDGRVLYTHEYQEFKDPKRWPVRSFADLRTFSLACEISKEIQHKKGCLPHMVINHLNRSKLDVNREIEEGTFGVEAAVTAWKTYHKFIEQTKKTIKGRGLILDIHGQNHPEEWIELGYTLPADVLNSGQYEACDTSVCSAFKNSKQKMDNIMDMISGGHSLGALLYQTNNQYKIVPSPQIPFPEDGNYYIGGYITQTHGSSQGGFIDSIQIECPAYVRLSPAKSSFAKNVAIAVCKYLELHY